ncbi:MAG TPA: gluconate 2-dehydrogenase subunit 3 family protein [Blastocatellia bacterium]|nr:gluconate 2-dehydrogenase subunit 3 family protein [Blastocatellia bacterium]
MKRRRFIQTAAAAPAIAIPATAPAAQPAAQRPQAEAPKFELSPLDAVGETTTRFFSAIQLATLRRLSDILMPAMNGMPGALEAGAPEFLDFLIGASAADRKQLYKNGLDTLQTQAQKKFGKAFADLNETQANELLAPLRKPWTYNPPTDPFERFLREVKADVRTATINSREYSTAGSAGRRGGGMGQYWYPID